MTDEELDIDDPLEIYFFGYAQGQKCERNLIMAWLRKSGRAQIADAIKEEEHLK